MDSAKPPTDASVLLSAAGRGDQKAARDLLPLVYDELRRAAGRVLSGERAGHTLTPTALVHEAYLKVAGPRDVPWADRRHFYFAAAEAMRRILIDHARARGRRVGPALPLTDVVDLATLASADSEQIEAVDRALTRLEEEDSEAAAIVRLRLYSGLSVEQSAEALGVSPRTAARLWQFARAKLYRSLTQGPPADARERG